jgi:hypothetical protein
MKTTWLIDCDVVGNRYSLELDPDGTAPRGVIVPLDVETDVLITEYFVNKYFEIFKTEVFPAT